MRVDYQISEEDFAFAQRLALKRSSSLVSRWMFSVIPGFGLFLLLVMIFLIANRGFSGNFPGLAVAIALLLFPLLTKWNIRRLYRRSTNLHGTRSMDADDAGLSFQGPTFSSRLAWDHFSRFAEDQHSFLIFQSSRIFNVIPKSGLTPEQIAGLHELLSTHIPGRK